MNNPVSDSGLVLIITIWVLAILSLLSLSFAHYSRMEIELNSLRADKLKCLYHAREGINCAIQVLARDKNAFDGLNEAWKVHPSFETELLTKGVSYTIVDEDSKVNINTASQEHLKRLLDIGDDVASSIIEFRGGNNIFHFVSELLYVKGMTPAVFYGQKDTNNIGIKELVTVWTDGLININTAPIDVLVSIPGMRKVLAESIIQYRQGHDFQDGTNDDNPFEDLEELKNVPGISLGEYSQVSGYLKTSSREFRITSEAALPYSRLKGTITAIVERDKNKIKILMWEEG